MAEIQGINHEIHDTNPGIYGWYSRFKWCQEKQYLLHTTENALHVYAKQFYSVQIVLQPFNMINLNVL